MWKNMSLPVPLSINPKPLSVRRLIVPSATCPPSPRVPRIVRPVEVRERVSMLVCHYVLDEGERGLSFHPIGPAHRPLIGSQMRRLYEPRKEDLDDESNGCTAPARAGRTHLRIRRRQHE